ncbi:MAG: hypothetical protein JST54_19885 [Deltaproteobacteria bacterium]|nr:hypothetical protein [Deltaproteobacteria bacterium]
MQLYLETARKGRLESSHTNHNSAARADKWAPIYPELKQPAARDFQRINAFSSRLNREIRKRAVAKVSTRVVPPGALALCKKGIQLGPFDKRTFGCSNAAPHPARACSRGSSRAPAST